MRRRVTVELFKSNIFPFVIVVILQYYPLPWRSFNFTKIVINRQSRVRSLLSISTTSTVYSEFINKTGGGRGLLLICFLFYTFFFLYFNTSDYFRFRMNKTLNAIFIQSYKINDIIEKLLQVIIWRLFFKHHNKNIKIVLLTIFAIFVNIFWGR